MAPVFFSANSASADSISFVCISSATSDTMGSRPTAPRQRGEQTKRQNTDAHARTRCGRQHFALEAVKRNKLELGQVAVHNHLIVLVRVTTVAQRLAVLRRNSEQHTKNESEARITCDVQKKGMLAHGVARPIMLSAAIFP